MISANLMPDGIRGAQRQGASLQQKSTRLIPQRQALSQACTGSCYNIGPSRSSLLPTLEYAQLGYTLAEKLLAAHAGQPAKAGDVVVAGVDFAMIHDARAANALKQLEKLDARSLPYASRTALVLDH